MNDEETRRRFFYAMLAAHMYDATIEWVCPYYKLLHETLIHLVASHIEERQRAEPQSCYYVLDIGCGTGAESLSLLKGHPRLKVVGIDLAGPMLKTLEGKLERDRIEPQRFTPLEADFLTNDCLPERLKALMPAERRERGFDAVISAFTFHHFTEAQKADSYRRVYECLAPGGILLNGDLFNYDKESEFMTGFALDFELDWISEHFAAAAEHDPHMKELSGKWHWHYVHDNSCNSMSNQMKSLRDAGFRETANPFRYWQVGLLWGLK